MLCWPRAFKLRASKVIFRFILPSIRHAGAAPYMAFGEMDGRLSRRAEEIASRLGAAEGMRVEASQDIFADMWKNFMRIAPWEGRWRRHARTDRHHTKDTRKP